MKNKPDKSAFAPMKYLDDLLKQYVDGYPNRWTESYFRSLLEIRDIQSRGKAPVQIYKFHGSVERGYYLANIHYYLFDDCSEFDGGNPYKDTLNKRILFLLENADKEHLMERGWFPLNFPSDYLLFLERYYGSHRSSMEGNSTMWMLKNLLSLVDCYGNDTERMIIELATPIVEEYLGRERSNG